MCCHLANCQQNTTTVILAPVADMQRRLVNKRQTAGQYQALFHLHYAMYIKNCKLRAPFNKNIMVQVLGTKSVHFVLLLSFPTHQLSLTSFN